MKLNNHSKVKVTEYVLFTIAFLLLLTGFILTMVGSGTFSEYYVESVDIDHFYESFKEFFRITIEYSGVFYLGFLFIILSVFTFLVSLVFVVIDYEYYTKKRKELGIMLTKINPTKERVESVEVGAIYHEEIADDREIDTISN